MLQKSVSNESLKGKVKDTRSGKFIDYNFAATALVQVKKEKYKARKPSKADKPVFLPYTD